MFRQSHRHAGLSCSKPHRSRLAVSGTQVLVVVLFVLAVFVLPARAGAYYESFENFPADGLHRLYGQAMQGTEAFVSDGVDRTGGHALQIDYRFSARGWLEVYFSQRPKIEHRANVWVGMWIRGSNLGHFYRGAARFIDATGEVFEYPLHGIELALNGSEWTYFRRQIDLNAAVNSWGGNADGKVDEPVAFMGLVMAYRGPGYAEGTVYIDDVEVVVPSVPNLQIHLHGERDVPIYAPGEPASFEAEVILSQWILDSGRLTQAEVRSLTGRLIWQAHDWQHRPLAQGEEFVQLTAGGRLRIPIVVDDPEPGLLQLHVRLVDEQNAVAGIQSTQVAVFHPAEEPLATEPMFVGVAAHVGRYSEADRRKVIEIASHTGFAGVRFDLVWNRVQPRAGVWEWDVYDVIFSELEAANLRPLPLLAYSTPWASTGDPNAPDDRAWRFAPPKVDAYVEFASRAVERYASYTPSWEIWNEPDHPSFWLGTADQYAELFSAAYRALHKVSPTVTVLNGGFSEVKRHPDFIPNFLSLTEELPDVYAFHSHGPWTNLRRAALDTQRYLTGAGWEPESIWLNEAGFSSVGHQTDTAQAAEVVKKVTFAASQGYQGYIWYNLRNDGTDPNENEHNFGLVKADLRQNPLWSPPTPSCGSWGASGPWCRCRCLRPA